MSWWIVAFPGRLQIIHPAERNISLIICSYFGRHFAPRASYRCYFGVRYDHYGKAAKQKSARRGATEVGKGRGRGAICPNGTGIQAGPVAAAGARLKSEADHSELYASVGEIDRRGSESTASGVERSGQPGPGGEPLQETKRRVDAKSGGNGNAHGFSAAWRRR